MADRKTKFLVGLFMISGTGIGLAAVIWLGMSHFLEEGRRHATYFDQSVQGLDIDSPVKYRGVSIGRVEKIMVAPDSRLIEVVMSIDSNISLEPDMVARLKVVGITGSMFIEIDRGLPGDLERTPRLGFSPNYPVIASKPSEISLLFEGVDKIVRQLNALDLVGAVRQFTRAMETVSSSFESMEMENISRQTIVALENLNHNLDSRRWDRIVHSLDESIGSFRQFMGDLNGTVREIDAMVGQINEVVAKNKDTVHASLHEFRQTLQSSSVFLSSASLLVDDTGKKLENLNSQLQGVVIQSDATLDNMNQLLNRIARQPSLLLFGKKPPERPLEDDPFKPTTDDTRIK